MITSSIFAAPRDVASVDECLFYHTMELPGLGVMEGLWDLRADVDKYLGYVDLKGKRVLEVGTASGYLCYHMESKGADVVAFELAPDETADIVPFARASIQQMAADMQPWMEKIRNGYWFAHKVLNSKAKVVYGNVYHMPAAIGLVDVSTFGAILLHLRDPFLALENALRLTTETVIITEPIWNWTNYIRFKLLPEKFHNSMKFIPQAQICFPPTTWWHISPIALKKFIAVLGFENATISYHSQQHVESGKKVPYCTVVGHRTVPLK